VVARFPIGISLMDGGGTLPGGYVMADIIGKIEGLAGLALLGGVAYAALKFGPTIINAFKDAGKGARDVLDVLSPKSAVSTHADAVRDALDAEQRAWEAGDALEAERQNAIARREAYKSAFDAGSTILGWNPFLQAATRFAGDLAVDAIVPRDTVSFVSGKAASTSAVSFVSGQASDINFDANLAKKQAEWQAAQDARTEAVKLLVQERNAALAAEREAQRIRNEQQYNAWLQSTRPASSVTSFLTVGKQYQGQQEVAPGVYVAPSGAYQVIQGGQIVAAGSAGAVQGALVAANADMYPGTNYRREVVEGYQAKARAGDAAASAWLKRFAPAGAV
jgi:hypothetical protein